MARNPSNGGNSDWVYAFDFNLLLGRYPARGKGAISEIFLKAEGRRQKAEAGI
jgi:hypothetical protein